MTDIVVAGAGLAGLVAARRLAESGLDVEVIERNEVVGGRVRSRARDGYTLDTGFQVLFPAYPAVRRELDTSALDLRPFRPGAVLAHDGQRSVLSDPLRDPAKAIESALNRKVTVSDKLRTLALRQHVRSREYDELLTGSDQSIRAYLKEWGFSGKFIRNFAAPFYGGITLDRSLSTSKRVFEYTFRALSDGAAAVPAQGMGAIPTQLRERVEAAGATITTGEDVRSVDAGGGDVAVETDARSLAPDAVVVATDPRTARELTGVESIPTDARGCVTQHYRLPDAPALPIGKRLLLNVDDPMPNTVAPMSTVAPEYAPDDDVLLSATFLGDDAFASDDDELLAAGREALRSWFPERRFDGLELIESDRIPFAQFAQPPGVHDDLPDARDPDGPVYLAGDYTEWSSIQGALESGRNAADAVLADG